MGEPAVPDVDDRANAVALADTLLAYVRDDEPMPPLDERQLWLLASTLVWMSTSRLSPREIDALAERMFDAAELERVRRDGGERERWAALSAVRRLDWTAAAHAAVTALLRSA